MTETAIYLDDLYVGQRFTSGTHRMEEADIVTFAATFDPQPFHLDREASGWHTAAIAMRLLVTGGLPLRGRGTRSLQRPSPGAAISAIFMVVTAIVCVAINPPLNSSVILETRAWKRDYR
jgi:acyl dehydratase